MRMHTLNSAVELDFLFNQKAMRNNQSRYEKTPTKSTERSAVNIPVDISEDKQAFYIHADIPGVSINNIKVSVDKNILTLSGKKESTFLCGETRTEESAEGMLKSHACERHLGDFSRRFTLPDSVDSQKLNAKFSDGVLRLQIPKKEEDVHQSFDVKISS
jgi:HSP20 family protein